MNCIYLPGDSQRFANYHRAVNRAGAAVSTNAPEDCCALEDSRNGLLSAHAAGMQAIMVPDLWQPDDTVKQFILGPFESLLEVRDWLVARQ